MQEQSPLWASSLPIFAFFFFVILFAFWISQFVHLMKRSDADFPGRYDKLIWAMLLMLTNVLGRVHLLDLPPTAGTLVQRRTAPAV